MKVRLFTLIGLLSFSAYGADSFERCFQVNFDQGHMQNHPLQIARSLTLGLGANGFAAVGINFQESRGFMDAINSGHCDSSSQKLECQMHEDQGSFTLSWTEKVLVLDIKQELFLDYQADYGQADTWYRVGLKPDAHNGQYHLSEVQKGSCQFLLEQR